MGRFFTHERFGRPQALAACLLLAILAQCFWLLSSRARPGTVDLAEIYRLERGTALWQSKAPESEAHAPATAPGLEKPGVD